MKNILIVDDNELDRKLLKDILTNAGYLTDGAGSGEEAIEKVTAGCFDLILLDVVMPGRNGLDVMPDLKRLRPGVKIIVITAFATIESAVAAIKRGASEYISKPFNMPEVLLIIKKLWKSQPLRRPLRNRILTTLWPLCKILSGEGLSCSLAQAMVIA